MKNSVRKQSKTKRIKYSLFAILSLLSLIAYTMHYNASQSQYSDQLANLGKTSNKAKLHQELHTPFVQRWNKVYAEVHDYLNEDGFQKTRFFLDGEIVASNDVFELPTEETGAGLEQYIQDLNDAVIADMVPNQVSANGGSAGGIGGGGGGSGGGRDKKKQTPYQTISDLDPSNTGNGGDTELSAVPAPPAIWLLGSAILGLIGLRRK